MTSKDEEGKKVTRCPVASVMTEMKPLTKVTPSSEVSPHREACEKAFILACRYSEGHDLVEEMVASKFWPLGKSWPSFIIEMVKVPIYDEAARVPFPHFGIGRAEDETPEEFAAIVEQEAREIVGDITDKEFLA